MSERRAGLESTDAGAEPPVKRGRLLSLDEMSGTIQWSCRGSGDSMRVHSMRVQGELTQHGKPHTVGQREAHLDAREGQARLHRVGGEGKEPTSVSRHQPAD